MRRNHGFSLIEVLLALAVGGIVLMAASSLLVTISQAWANRPATRDAFDAHVNGVAHFLTAMLEEATNPKDGSKGNEAIELARPVGFSDREDPLIKFHLHKLPLFFIGLTDWPIAHIPIFNLRKARAFSFCGIQSFRSWRNRRAVSCSLRMKTNYSVP